MDGYAPFPVMILHIKRIAAAPWASGCLAVQSQIYLDLVFIYREGLYIFPIKGILEPGACRILSVSKKYPWRYTSRFTILFQLLCIKAQVKLGIRQLMRYLFINYFLLLANNLQLAVKPKTSHWRS